ncbi:MAG TPA: zinc-dependent alcohol dehydrogenase family protein [Syntrophales bacterium]|nr:zinc-dependent alcohol dehydrogenase family protein [Syntrophales bacterium]
MKAMVLRRLGRMDADASPLEAAELPIPVPGPREVLIRVSACGVCHTELDEIEGRTPPPSLPVIPGHQVAGRVADMGSAVTRFRRGDRVGVGWIHSACGGCAFCRQGRENLCPDFRATGRDVQGGYAEYTTVPENFAFPLPDAFSDTEAAPLLCAGAIGYRSLKLAGLADGDPLGLTGFGASAHLVLKMVRHRYPRTRVHVFARREEERRFALDLGAAWVGDTGDTAPEPLSAVIDTTPAWRPVLEALRNLSAGGRLVVNAIRKEEADRNELNRLDYPTHLWLEKEIRSVANVTRTDIGEFLELAAGIPLRPRLEVYPLAEANRALTDLKAGRIRGAKVLAVA